MSDVPAPPPDAPAPALEYAPQPGWVRRRWKRLVLLALATLLSTSLVLWRHDVHRLAATARLLHAQHRCLTFQPPEGQVAYEEDPDRLAGLLMRPEYRPGPKADGTPGAALWWPAAARQWPEASAYLWMSPTPGILFMGELKTPKGRRVLVVATANHEADVSDGVGVRVQAVEPATWRRPSASAAGMATIATKPPRDRDHRLPITAPVRFYAGRRDPSDPSRFNVEYEAGPHRGVMKGWVKDGAPQAWPTVRLEWGQYPIREEAK